MNQLKWVTILFLSSVICTKINAQKIKEKFDFLTSSYSKGFYGYEPYSVPNSKNGDQFDYSDGLKYILEGYLVNYETTKDKAYLYRFMVENLKIMSTRFDNFYLSGSGDLPKWTVSTSQSIYADGYILAVFAKFNYLVKSQNLTNVAIYPFPSLSPGATCTDCFNYTNINFTTFGQYADWLQSRLNETLNYYVYNNSYWNEFEGMIRPNGNSTETLIANQQSGFAKALLYSYLYTNTIDYLHKANVIATKMVGTINMSGYNGPWLFDAPNNSYFWYSDGWSLFDDITYAEYIEKNMEDLSHGCQVVEMYYDFWKHLPVGNINTNVLVKFHNTFTNNLYDGNGGFYASVNGTDYGYDPIAQNPAPIYIPHNIYAYRNINYIILSDFENEVGSYSNNTDGKSAYQIVKTFYDNNLNNMSDVNNTPSYFQGHSSGSILFGISSLANQQWQRECVDLSLFKRKLIYDQDFTAQGTLTIEPRADLPLFNAPTSFALPYITANEFTIEVGVTSSIEGGFGVKIKEGFTAKMGSNVTIKPAAMPCVKSMGSFVLEDDQPSEPTQLTNSVKDDIVNDNSLTIYPNPASNTFAITSTNFVAAFTVEIIDIQGKTMHSQSIISSNEAINISSLSSGLYFCKINMGDEIITQKLIVE